MPGVGIVAMVIFVLVKVSSDDVLSGVKFGDSKAIQSREY